MLQAFYSAAVGAQQQMLRMNVYSNNISNVNTQGYKTQVPAFQALMYGMLEGIDGSQLPRGTGTIMSLTGTNMETGDFQTTGRDLDFAIMGDGFFALYEPTTGQVTFTRDGSFMLSQAQSEEDPSVLNYYLCDGEGRQVLDNTGYPIVLSDPTQDFQVGVFTIQYHDGLERIGSSRFLMGEKNGAVWVGDAQVMQGVLEGSNVDLATEISGIIEAQRSYSYALRMVSTADEVETTINNLANG